MAPQQGAEKGPGAHTGGITGQELHASHGPEQNEAMGGGTQEELAAAATTEGMEEQQVEDQEDLKIEGHAATPPAPAQPAEAGGMDGTHQEAHGSTAPAPAEPLDNTFHG